MQVPLAAKAADNICFMELYGQDAELHLLSKLVAQLDHRTMIDVGAERGSLAQELLDVGVEELHAFDPHPDNAKALRTRFARDGRVTVHEHAVSDGDGSGELHVSTNPAGSPLPFGHTLLERVDTDEIAWRKTLAVTRRSLQSLIDANEIPGRTGILKIDTEGHDLAVVRGMGELEADVVMVEHWTDLPNGLGVCPWSTQEMVAELRARGFSHFAFIIHRDEFVTLKWDDGEVERGAMGNLVFLHDRALARLLPVVLDCAGMLAEHAVHIGQRYMQAAADRSALVDQLKQVADDRSALVDQLHETIGDRSVWTRELEQAANDRLALVDQLDQVANDRLARMNELEQVANDRLARMNELKQVANDRLARMNELEQVANDRLALVDEFHEAAEARLQALETTTTQLRQKSAELDALKSQRVDDPA